MAGGALEEATAEQIAPKEPQVSAVLAVREPEREVSTSEQLEKNAARHSNTSHKSRKSLSNIGEPDASHVPPAKLKRKVDKVHGDSRDTCAAPATAATTAESSAETTAAAAAAVDEWEYEDSFEDEYEEEDACMEEEESDGEDAAAATAAPAGGNCSTEEASSSDDDEELATVEEDAVAAATHEQLQERHAEKSSTKKKKKRKELRNKLKANKDMVPMQKQAWRPGVDALGEGETLECDASSYKVLHRLTLDWSCLSFDVIPSEKAAQQTKPPYSCYVVTGTQAEKAEGNRLFIMKWSDLHRTDKDGEADGEESSDEEKDEESDDEAIDVDPTLDFRVIAHKGTVNRVRACPQIRRLVASWADTGEVHIWDISKQLHRLDDPGAAGAPPTVHQPPKFTHKGLGVEGFAMDWNPVHSGKMLTGDIAGSVCLWAPREDGWEVSTIMGRKRLSSKKKCSDSNHSSYRFDGVSDGATIEECQWKLLGDGAGDIFATASSDGGIRLYDVRESSAAPCLMLPQAHASDVNALRWSPVHGELFLSGDESGCVKVWDTRYENMPLVVMHWHKKPITSVDWHPSDEATFATASLDNAVAFWDMSVEVDEDASSTATEKTEEQPRESLPDQLMFIHMGQEHVSEIKFHPQIPGALISTACDGFNFLKTCNI